MIAHFAHMRLEHRIVFFKLCLGTLGLVVAFTYTFFLQTDALGQSLNALQNRVTQITQKEASYYAKNGHFLVFGRQRQESVDGLAALGFDPRPFMKGDFEYQVTADSQTSVQVEGRVKDAVIRSGSMPLLVVQKTLTAQSAMELSQR